MEIKFVDIFAGPGGLGEGFSRYANFHSDDLSFRSVTSIEKDPVAAQTLTLRTWLHQYTDGSHPEIYEEFLKDKTKIDAIKETPEWKKASEIVWNAELGKVSEVELHSRIKSALAGEKNWILLGGPPCQAYSLIGRARMKGVGLTAIDENACETELADLREKKSKDFYNDHRHELYKEYLRIVAIHQPAVFVMENVKGILSAKIPDGSGQERIFPKILKDLTNPCASLEREQVYQQLKRFHPKLGLEYKLFSFVTGEDPDDTEFTIRSEQYGIPQKRHRVIILGIRQDITSDPKKLSISAPVSVRDTIEDMPPLRSGVSKGIDNVDTWMDAIEFNTTDDAQDKLGLKVGYRTERSNLKRCSNEIGSKLSKKNNPYARWLTNNAPKVLSHHESRSHMPSDLGRYYYAAAMTEKTGITPKLNQWPIGLLPKHKNVTFDESGNVKVGGFNDRFRVQAWDIPATTITSHISKDGHYYIHPSPKQCRSLTVREAARLQTFPDNYYFCGNRTQQYHQVGNAVPPLLAVQLAEIVAGIFKNLTK